MCLNIFKNNPGNSKDSDKDANRVGITVLIIAGLMALSCLVMFFSTCTTSCRHQERDREWMHLRDSIYADAVYIEDIFVSKANQVSQGKNVSSKNKNKAVADSIKPQYIISLREVDQIRKAQKALIARQDMLADDLRQETNNLINKMNGWLGFWMGVMAILGVFVPIALQIKLYRETRDNDARIRSDHEKDRSEIKDSLKEVKETFDMLSRQSRADIQAQCLSMETGIRERFDKMECDISNKIRQLDNMKFELLIRNFQNISDCPEISTNEHRNQLLGKNWEELLTILHRYVSDITRQPESEFDKYHLSVVLIQIASTLEIIKRISPNRSRPIKKLSDRAYTLTKEMHDISISTSDLIRNLQDFYTRLSSLHPFPL